MEELLVRYIKNAETTTNKIRLPKKATDILGKHFTMDVYKDKIVLIPTNKQKSE